MKVRAVAEQCSSPVSPIANQFDMFVSAQHKITALHTFKKTYKGTLNSYFLETTQHICFNLIKFHTHFKNSNTDIQNNQRTNGPVEAHLIYGSSISTKHTKPDKK